MKLSLPVMQCDAGCGECCGPTMCSESEWSRIQRVIKERGIQPVRQGVTCPLYIGGTCSIYDVRPFVCQLFGHTPDMRCIKGYNKNAPGPQVRKLNQDYRNKEGGASRFLHEIVYSFDEFEELIKQVVRDGLGVKQ